MPTMALGSRGEALAADYLEQDGWTILDRNHRSGRKEIDLVARRGEVVAFVEVKTRRGSAFGHPFEAITPRKQQGIQEVAAAWIDRNGVPGEDYRFDAVAVYFGAGSRPAIEHLEDAWRN